MKIFKLANNNFKGFAGILIQPDKWYNVVGYKEQAKYIPNYQTEVSNLKGKNVLIWSSGRFTVSPTAETFRDFYEGSMPSALLLDYNNAIKLAMFKKNQSLVDRLEKWQQIGLKGDKIPTVYEAQYKDPNINQQSTQQNAQQNAQQSIQQAQNQNLLKVQNHLTKNPQLIEKVMQILGIN